MVVKNGLWHGILLICVAGFWSNSVAQLMDIPGPGDDGFSIPADAMSEFYPEGASAFFDLEWKGGEPEMLSDVLSEAPASFYGEEAEDVAGRITETPVVDVQKDLAVAVEPENVLPAELGETGVEEDVFAPPASADVAAAASTVEAVADDVDVSAVADEQQQLFHASLEAAKQEAADGADEASAIVTGTIEDVVAPEVVAVVADISESPYEEIPTRAGDVVLDNAWNVYNEDVAAAEQAIMVEKPSIATAPVVAAVEDVQDAVAGALDDAAGALAEQQADIQAMASDGLDDVNAGLETAADSVAASVDAVVVDVDESIQAAADAVQENVAQLTDSLTETADNFMPEEIPALEVEAAEAAVGDIQDGADEVVEHVEEAIADVKPEKLTRLQAKQLQAEEDPAVLEEDLIFKKQAAYAELPIDPRQPPGLDESPRRKVERLLRSTRMRDANRAPFELIDGPEDPVVFIEGNELEQGIILMQEGNFERNLKNFDGAQELFNESIPLLEVGLRRNSGLEYAWEALGFCYFYADRKDDAKKLFEQYLTLRPDSPKAYSMLAQLAIDRSDWEAVDRYLKGALRLDPKNFDTRYWYAQNLMRLGELNSAMDIFEQLVLEDDYRTDVKIDLARLYMLTQYYDDAHDLWLDVVEEYPAIFKDMETGQPVIYRAELAMAELLVGNLEEADRQCRIILEEMPDYAPAMEMRANIAELSHRPEEIVASLLELIEESEDKKVETGLRVRLSARYIELNNQDAGRWPLELALYQMKLVLEEEPSNVAHLTRYAQICLMSQKYAEAEATIDEILTSFNPYNQHALAVRFELELSRGNFDAAEYALEERYTRFAPNNPYRHLDMARLELQRGRYQNALDSLNLLEEAGAQGTVLTLLYHGLTQSEWLAQTSTRRFREHILGLQEAGYTFISPSEIAEYFQSRPKAERPDPKPWLARTVDSFHYAFTGEKRVKQAEDFRPEKVAVITFDDGLRSSFTFATPIGEELGIPFGVMLITDLEERNAPLYASWKEIRTYADTGVWEIGSHLYKGHEEGPVDATGKQNLRALPNRLWNKAKNRPESMREWSSRAKSEFVKSREIIVEKMNLDPDEPLAVAYPFGDLGQDDISNVSKLVNPVRTILNEASRQYQIGFIQDAYGYTCSVDNPLLVRRYEPAWNEEAEVLLENAYENHPVFLARRMRAELAALMDKPYLADRQIALLQRDGYPPRLLRSLIAFTQNRLPTGGSTSLESTDRESTSSSRIQLSHLYVSGYGRQNRSSKDIEQSEIGVNVGANLNTKVGVEASAFTGRIKQTVESNYWYKIRQTETTSATSERTETTDGVTSTSTVTTRDTSTREVQTNRVDTYKYRADVQEVRAYATVRINDHASLLASGGAKTIKFKNDGPDGRHRETEFVGNIILGWKPAKALSLTALYDRNLVPSAREAITYDSIGMTTRWKASDRWDLEAQGRYWAYHDDINNSMIYLYGASYWLLFERQNVWGGLEGSVQSMDEHSDLYWSPYWDTRFTAVGRYKRTYRDYFLQFDVRLGMQREEARPEEKDAYKQLKANSEQTGGWYPGAEPGSDFDVYVGFSGTYRQRLFGHWDIFTTLYVNFLRDYAEHDVTGGVQYTF